MNHEPRRSWRRLCWQAMGRRWLPVWIASVVFLLACAGILTASWPEPIPTSTPVELPSDVGVDQKLDTLVPLDLKFKDESGRDVALQEYFSDGKPVVLNLVYLQCPMLCNMAMDGLIRNLRALSLSAGQDFRVLTVSFDPREGPDLAAESRKTALRRYAREGAETGWHFLTGEEPSIRALSDAVGFRYSWNEQRGQYAHPAVLMLLTPEGRLSRYFAGVEYPARDLRLGLVEASEGGIGTATDHVMLMCFQYDPTTGKYGLVVMNLLRCAGMATMIVLVTGVYMMTRRAAELSHVAGPESASRSVVN
jgi:protein SCO1/2